jgi:hypothetical protein
MSKTAQELYNDKFTECKQMVSMFKLLCDSDITSEEDKTVRDTFITNINNHVKPGPVSDDETYKNKHTELVGYIENILGLLNKIQENKELQDRICKLRGVSDAERDKNPGISCAQITPLKPNKNPLPNCNITPSTGGKKRRSKRRKNSKKRSRKSNRKSRRH